MIHPIQSIASTKDGSLHFFVIRNMVQAYAFNVQSKEFILAGEWADEFDIKTTIKDKVVKEQQRQLAQNASKKQKDNNGVAVERPRKEAAVPTPGPGAPPIYHSIRCLTLSHDEKTLVACTNSDKAAIVFNIDLTKDNCLNVKRRQSFPKRPSAVTMSFDSKNVLLADKFGDVYSMDLTHEGLEGALQPILGHVSMLTDIVMTKDNNGREYIITADRDEHIKISHFPQSYIVDKWLFGHTEFVSSLAVPKWRSELLFSVGGDNGIKIWNWQTGELLSNVDLSNLVKPYLTDTHLPPERFLVDDGSDQREISIAKIITFRELPYVVTFVEATKAVLVFKFAHGDNSLCDPQILEMPHNVTDIDVISESQRIVVSLDNRVDDTENFVKFFSHNEGIFTAEEDRNNLIAKALRQNLVESKIANVGATEVYPMYHVAQLRKRGEH